MTEKTTEGLACGVQQKDLASPAGGTKKGWGFLLYEGII